MPLRSRTATASVAAEEPPVATQNRCAPLRPAAPAALQPWRTNALSRNWRPMPLRRSSQNSSQLICRPRGNSHRRRVFATIRSSLHPVSIAAGSRSSLGTRHCRLLDLDVSRHRDHRPSRNPQGKRRRHANRPSAGGHARQPSGMPLIPKATETTRSPRNRSKAARRRLPRGR
jgi:hypothetical protein